MTEEKAQLMGKLLGIVSLLVIDIAAGYLMGHQFHSFIIGYVTYSGLVGIDSALLKLNDIRESLKGGR